MRQWEEFTKPWRETLYSTQPGMRLSEAILQVPSPPRSGEKVAAGRMSGLTVLERIASKIELYFAPSPYPSPPVETMRSWEIDCGGERTIAELVAPYFCPRKT